MAEQRPDVPVTHADEVEHRRLLAQRANIGLPYDGSRNMTGRLRIISGDDILFLGTGDRDSEYGFPDSAYLVIDKTATADDASIVLRDNGNARAEIGLVTDNDIHFKTVTGTFGSETFTDRMIIKAAGFVDVFDSILRVNEAAAVARIIAGNSNGVDSGAGLELTYDQVNKQAVLTSIERGNTYRPIIWQGQTFSLELGNGTVSQILLASETGMDIKVNPRLVKTSPALRLRDSATAVDSDGLYSFELVSGQLQILRNTAAGGDFSTSDTVTVFRIENDGNATDSGDGGVSAFTIAHGLQKDGSGITPTRVQVTAGSEDAAGDFWATADDTNITVNYATPPSSGTDNLTWYWQARE